MAVKLNEWWDNFLFGTDAEKEAVKQAQDNLYAAKLEKKRLLAELNKAATEEERMRTRNLIDAQNKIIDESTATINQRKGLVPKAGDVAARTMESTGRGMSQAFAQGISDWAANQSARGTTAPDKASAHLQQQATMHDIQAGDLQKAQQQSQQIADRDYHAEAEKNAVAGAATENAQRVQNLSASAGAGAAALNRQVKSADYNTMMNRADTQRDKAVERGKEAWDVRQQAERERAGADKADYAAREAETDNRRATNLSYGTGTTWDDTSYNVTTAPKPQEPEPKPEEPVTPKPQEPEPKPQISADSRPDKVTNVTADSTEVLPTSGPEAIDEKGNMDSSKVNITANKPVNVTNNNGVRQETPSAVQPVTGNIGGFEVTYDKSTKALLGKDTISKIDEAVTKHKPEGVILFSQYVKNLKHYPVTTDDLQAYVSTLPAEESDENGAMPELKSNSWTNDAIVNGVTTGPGYFTTQGMNQ